LKRKKYNFEIEEIEGEKIDKERIKMKDKEYNFIKEEYNDVFTEIHGFYYIILENKMEEIEGWASIDDKLEDYLTYLNEQIEFEYGYEYNSKNLMDEFNLYFICVFENNSFYLIKNQTDFNLIKKIAPKFFLLLHKNHNVEYVQRSPQFNEWIRNSLTKLK